MPKTVKITLSDDAYWKLVEIKTTLRCKTWDSLADALHQKFLEMKKKGKTTFEF